MASEDPQQDLSAVERPDAKSVEAHASTSPSPSAPPPFHEPRMFCRPHRRQDTGKTFNTFRFAFLAEGAANVVFRVVPYSSLDGEECFVFEDDKGNILEGQRLVQKVLRMSKGTPKTLRYREIMDGFEAEVMPLFRKTEPSQEGTRDPNSAPRISINESFEEFAMEHQGVVIAPQTLKALFVELHTHCADNTHIEPHLLERNGILLPDMSSIPGSVTTIEIKPKWLLQSPNAPRDAYLCRTCALHASRKSKQTYKEPYICPLALVAGNTAAIELYLRDKSYQALAEEMTEGLHRYLRPDEMIEDRTEYPKFSERERKRVRERPLRPAAEVEAILERAVPYLTSGPGHKILQHLRYLQSQLDQEGVLCHHVSLEKPEDDFLRLAMTLRDCSLYIRIPWADQNAPIEAKLGDLDFKSRVKLGDWSLKEEKLLHGGWYVNLDSGMDECWIAQGWKRDAPHYF